MKFKQQFLFTRICIALFEIFKTLRFASTLDSDLFWYLWGYFALLSLWFSVFMAADKKELIFLILLSCLFISILSCNDCARKRRDTSFGVCVVVLLSSTLANGCFPFFSSLPVHIYLRKTNSFKKDKLELPFEEQRDTGTLFTFYSWNEKRRRRRRCRHWESDDDARAWYTLAVVSLILPFCLCFFCFLVFLLASKTEHSLGIEFSCGISCREHGLEERGMKRETSRRR